MQRQYEYPDISKQVGRVKTGEGQGGGHDEDEEERYR